MKLYNKMKVLIIYWHHKNKKLESMLKHLNWEYHYEMKVI